MSTAGRRLFFGRSNKRTKRWRACAAQDRAIRPSPAEVAWLAGVAWAKPHQEPRHLKLCTSPHFRRGI